MRVLTRRLMPVLTRAPRRALGRGPGRASDVRLPGPGGVLTRLYKGQRLEVTVLARGFAYAGTIYRSLSAVAKAITGSHCSGFLFFRLAGKAAKRREAAP
jgi:hypothetical protein